MKRTTILGAFLALITTAATAQDITFFGEAEYAVEADAFEAGVGADIAFEALTFTPAVYGDRVNDTTDFNRAEITVSYAFTDATSAYVAVETDRDWKYAETTFGARLEF